MKQATDEAACWALIAAAGSGSRLGADKPKQYLTINGKTLIEHALWPFCEHESIKGIVVVTATDDAYWPSLPLACHPKITRTEGGRERRHSVYKGLCALAQQAAADDWALVHDAARPCLGTADIDRLLSALRQHPVGGALGMPVRDTMKRTNARGEALATVERQHLWHAMTPQMFRLQRLQSALQQALDEAAPVTDEMQAVERLGMRAMLIPCGGHNIKVTRAEDLALAAFYLASPEARRCE